MRQLRVWQLVPVRKIMYEGHYRDLVFYTSRIFEPGKRRRVGICDDSSEPSLLPYTKYGCLAERIHVVYLTCSSLRQPSIFFFSSFIIFFSACWNLFIFCKIVYTKRSLLKTFSLENCAKYKTCAKMCKIWNETCAICTGFIFCTFFETIFCNFEINGYFHFFGGEGVVGVAVEGDIGRFY